MTSDSSRNTQAFILASTDYGTMIVNRFDYKVADSSGGFFGVGAQLLHKGCFDPEEIRLALTLLSARRKRYGDGVVAIDCGANIGAHTLAWAKHMRGWGEVHAYEAQDRIFYALAGNIAINNCFNAKAYNKAVADQEGKMDVPCVDYCMPGSFGSLELVQTEKSEDIGQKINPKKTTKVERARIDNLDLARLDFLKVDVEGMELDVLRGARRTLEASKPSMIIEIYKSEKEQILKILSELGYKYVEMGFNVVAVHLDDPISGSQIFQMEK